MSYRVRYRAEALDDVRRARDWYEAHRSGLGFRFEDTFFQVAESLAHSPERCPVLEGEYRRMLVGKFPYLLIFRLHEDTAQIVAVFHAHRDPESLRRRLDQA